MLGLPEACSELLPLALTHRSYAYENDVPSNERLEFLGDSVLGLVVTEYLFDQHPLDDEGHLAKMRAQVVSTRALAGVARDNGLGAFIRLGRGETRTGGADKDSILADTVEAVLGAVHLAAGPAAASALVMQLLRPRLDEAAALGDGLDPKTSLQEIASRQGWGYPRYVIGETGPDHAKSFTAVVELEIGTFGYGEGSSKKDAEHHAARTAFAELRSRVGADEVGGIDGTNGTDGTDGPNDSAAAAGGDAGDDTDTARTDGD